MYEVIDNMEMPKSPKAKKFPDLKIGQGFVFSSDGYKKGVQTARNSVVSSYHARGQRVTACSTPDGQIAVKRIA